MLRVDEDPELAVFEIQGDLSNLLENSLKDLKDYIYGTAFKIIRE